MVDPSESVPERAGQIIAIGGLSSEPENRLLEQYIVAQSARSNPAVCFLPQASGESSDYIIRFYTAFTRLPCRPSHLSLFEPPTADLESFLLEKDVIYVGGGSTRSMLALWRQWELDRILRLAWQAGVVLAGWSAGSICWFEQGVTDSIPGSLTPLACLGYLPGSNCPHYDGEIDRRPAYRRLIGEGLLQPGYAADDGVGLHFRGSRLDRVVSSRPRASGYRVGIEQTTTANAERGTEPATSSVPAQALSSKSQLSPIISPPACDADTFNPRLRCPATHRVVILATDPVSCRTADHPCNPRPARVRRRSAASLFWPTDRRRW